MVFFGCLGRVRSISPLDEAQRANRARRTESTTDDDDIKRGDGLGESVYIGGAKAVWVWCCKLENSEEVGQTLVPARFSLDSQTTLRGGRECQSTDVVGGSPCVINFPFLMRSMCACVSSAYCIVSLSRVGFSLVALGGNLNHSEKPSHTTEKENGGRKKTARKQHHTTSGMD